MVNYASSMYSCTCFVVKFANFPILWVSKLQTEVALSTTEVCDAIWLMTLIQEISGSLYFELLKPEVQIKQQLPSDKDKVNMVCEVYEDNRCALESAKVHKIHPRTRHITLKYHHFCEHVKNVLVRINPINIHEQLADIFMKSLQKQPFQYLCGNLCGW